MKTALVLFANLVILLLVTPLWLVGHILRLLAETFMRPATALARLGSSLIDGDSDEPDKE